MHPVRPGPVCGALCRPQAGPGGCSVGRAASAPGGDRYADGSTGSRHWWAGRGRLQAPKGPWVATAACQWPRPWSSPSSVVLSPGSAQLALSDARVWPLVSRALRTWKRLCDMGQHPSETTVPMGGTRTLGKGGLGAFWLQVGAVVAQPRGHLASLGLWGEVRGGFLEVVTSGLRLRDSCPGKVRGVRESSWEGTVPALVQALAGVTRTWSSLGPACDPSRGGGTCHEAVLTRGGASPAIHEPERKCTSCSAGRREGVGIRGGAATPLSSGCALRAGWGRTLGSWLWGQA